MKLLYLFVFSLLASFVFASSSFEKEVEEIRRKIKEGSEKLEEQRKFGEEQFNKTFNENNKLSNCRKYKDKFDNCLEYSKLDNFCDLMKQNNCSDIAKYIVSECEGESKAYQYQNVINALDKYICVLDESNNYCKHSEIYHKYSVDEYVSNREAKKQFSEVVSSACYSNICSNAVKSYFEEFVAKEPVYVKQFGEKQINQWVKESEQCKSSDSSESNSITNKASKICIISLIMILIVLLSY